MCGRQSPDRKRKNAALFCKPVTVGFPPSAALSLLPAFVPAVCVATLRLSVSMSCCCAVLLLCECGYHFVIRSEIQHREVFLYHLCLSLTVISSLMHPLSLSLSSNSLSSLGIRSFFLFFCSIFLFPYLNTAISLPVNMKLAFKNPTFFSDHSCIFITIWSATRCAGNGDGDLPLGGRVLAGQVMEGQGSDVCFLLISDCNSIDKTIRTSQTEI